MNNKKNKELRVDFPAALLLRAGGAESQEDVQSGVHENQAVVPERVHWKPVPSDNNSSHIQVLHNHPELFQPVSGRLDPGSCRRGQN